ncbi:DHA2 family efflux MFS transporter permease subunit [Gordonia neofelifaecis]|uniref:Permease of the major facilitator superfamily protein n=1 Tax=Gordonia neofelifaecis NRRL B-59395 TaxID=644548 RepID=F1YKD2_9ACTN|nr:DHA2 family efflux MFS transporter permease subunit [Gordonia neofelifaecis]EGD54818.1 permease of the major facilitator superfamily protein [Gordonia neofelifaecis NRRL B-59395]
MTTSPAASGAGDTQRSPWPALWALVIGFFMVLVDTTIVSVANPAIKEALDPDTNNLDNVVWVTSAYLLAYAVPLLITGRLGDRFGPRNLYLIGITVFTLSSLGCGLSNTLTMLIAFRAVQGLGAAMVTPQTMAVITRTFPPHQRGAAMGLWGSVAGIAMLVGPLAGGLLVDHAGWEWIFFVNVPVGIIGFAAAWKLVPKLETHPHRFDLVGVAISTIGLFLIVFGLQEGQKYDWAAWVWVMVIGGVAIMALFLWQQSRTSSEPLVPLELFRDRNFSISNIGIAVVGFAVTSMTLPMMFFIQVARGLSPTKSALLLIPMAVLAGILAPLAGKLLDRTDPRFLLVPGIGLYSVSLFWYASMMNADTPIPMFLLPAALMGIANAGMWGPLATTATRNLPPRQAGAGAGIYNTTRQIGSVIGSAAIAAAMQGRLQANVPGATGTDSVGTGSLPDFLVAPFSTAMAQSMLLPAAVLLIGVVAVAFMKRPESTKPEFRASLKAGAGTTV